MAIWTLIMPYFRSEAQIWLSMPQSKGGQHCNSCRPFLLTHSEFALWGHLEFFQDLYFWNIFPTGERKMGTELRGFCILYFFPLKTEKKQRDRRIWSGNRSGVAAKLGRSKKASKCVLLYTPINQEWQLNIAIARR